MPFTGVRQSAIGCKNFLAVNINRSKVNLEIIIMTSECGRDDLTLRSCIQGLFEKVTGVKSQSTYNLPHNIIMDKLPVEMLLGIFELVSYKDLKNVVLVCRRWREIGETPRFWSSFPAKVKTRNMSVMSEMLSSRRMKQLKKLTIESTLSEEVSHTIMNHPVLREFKLSEEEEPQTIISVLNVICSRGYKGTVLDMSENDMFDIDPELLAKVVTKLQKLEINCTELTLQQAAAIFTAVSEESTMIELDISDNDLSGVDPELLAKAVNNLTTLYIENTNLTLQQTEAILTAVSEGSKMIKLNIVENNMSGVDPGLLAKAVANLETLDIGRTELTQQQATAILSGISKGTKLTKLNISLNNLSGVDSELLAKAVANLETLDIGSTERTECKATKILSGVSKGSEVTQLNMSWNNLYEGDRGLLVKALNNLESLDVIVTELITQQAAAILYSVSDGSKLTKLNITGNLTQQQAVALSTAISVGCKLCRLFIGGNNLSAVAPGLLAKVVSNLESLSVGHTKLTQQQAAAILTAVLEGSKLTSFIIWGNNNLTEVDPELLAKAVKKLLNLLTAISPLYRNIS